MNNKPRVRRSLFDLQKEYEQGNKKPLEDLMRAWKGIKELPPDDSRSFYMLGGFHGAPFRGAGWGSAAYWGGYCNHGNILFPTWHRIYLFKLEEALRSIPGCQDVTLPYWDETADESLKNGIPWALTKKTFMLDGVEIDNPLRSYVFPMAVIDHIPNGDPVDYSKPKGYETVRYPLSGLVGNDKDREETAAHNAKYPDYDKNVEILNRNIINWLTSYIEVEGKKIPTNVAKKYRDCLDTPNYTVFSNTTSAKQWNDQIAEGSQKLVPLESPHNSIHLAVGGCDVPGFDSSPIDGANGDMGENDTAGFDPIFFFHHCFVDRVFWLWQKRHASTEKLEIIPEYPGTNSVDGQNPTPGTAPNSWLTLDSPLDPFKLVDADGKQRPYTSNDCVNIETQLGYTYGPGSLEDLPKYEHGLARLPTKSIRVSGVSRAPVAGSFLISAFITIDGKQHHLGTEAVLSRWHVQGCANCLTHLDVTAFFPLPEIADSANAAVERALPEVQIKVRTRKETLVQSDVFAAKTGNSTGPLALTAPAAPQNNHRRFRVSVV